MSADTGGPDLERLRSLLAARDAQRAAGRATPRSPAERLARAVAGRPDPAVTCEDAQARLPECVVHLLRGAHLPEDLAAAVRHAEACAECGPLLATLLAAEEDPQPEPSAAPDLAGLRRRRALHQFQEFVRQTVRAVLGPQRPDLLSGLDGVSGLIFAQADASGRLSEPGARQVRAAPELDAAQTSEMGRFITATYLALQRLAEAAPPAILGSVRESPDLTWRARDAALQSAGAAGLNPEQAAFFVDGFTAQISAPGAQVPPLP